MKRTRLLKGKSSKPQNQISAQVQLKAAREIKEWLVSEEVIPYHANLLAYELLDRAIDERINKTSDSAADIILSDADKIISLVSVAKHIADELDKAGELEIILGDLVDKDNTV